MVHLISKSSASPSVRIAKNGTHAVVIIQSDFHTIQMVAKNSVVVKRIGSNGSTVGFSADIFPAY